MNKDIIKAYIEYAIENWFNKYTRFSDWFEVKKSLYKKEEWLWILLNNNLLEIIQSKEFIEAITRWLTKDFCITEDFDLVFKEKVKRLLIHQAKAIANFEWDTLEDFIINLWIWKKN